MKAIINGKLYNTDTAKEIGYASYGGSRRDFQWFEETLYKKRTGEFFLFGTGGPMSHYAEPCGLRGYCGGSRIIPLSIDDAKRWAEQHLSVDDYISTFGDVDE